MTVKKHNYLNTVLVVTAIVSSSFDYQDQKYSAASRYYILHPFGTGLKNI
jgi:hypothetical protein